MFSFMPFIRDGIVNRIALPALLLMGMALASGFLASGVLVPDARAQIASTDIPMPEFENQSEKAWINSEPLKKADLKGKVVLMEVWTSI